LDIRIAFEVKMGRRLGFVFGFFEFESWLQVAEFAEAAEGTIAGAGVAGGVVVELAEGEGRGDRSGMGEGGAGDVIQLGVGLVELGRELVDGVIEEGGDEGPCAAQEPFGDGVLLDDAGFGGVGGLEALEVGLE
jgi:hypothetical protein